MAPRRGVELRQIQGPWTEPLILALTGIMAAGKSTVAELLVQQFPKSVHLRGDLFRRMIVNGRAEIRPGFPGDDEAQLALRYRLAAEVADVYAGAGFSVVVQDVILGQALADLVTMVRHRPLALVVLAPSPKVVEQREAQRSKKGYVSGWTVGTLDHMLRTETPRLGLWLDTSAQSAEETVDEILRRLWDEALI